MASREQPSVVGLGHVYLKQRSGRAERRTAELSAGIVWYIPRRLVQPEDETSAPSETRRDVDE